MSDPSDDTKNEPIEETKPEGEEAKPVAEEAKPVAEEAKPVAEEAKPVAKEKKVTEEQDKEDQEPSELENKIITQIEYYFGDHNLTKDKFLRGKIREDNGWVLLSVLLTFNRLKALTEDAEVIVNALKKSPAKLLEVSEDGTKIRRNPEKPVPERENWKEEEWQRTAYVKGFPVDSTFDAIMGFFKNEGKVSNVFMKKNFHSKTFKGSVFVTFETKEEVEAFVKKEGQKYKSTILIKELRHDYHLRKQSEFTKRKEEREKRKLEKQEKNAEEVEKAVADFNPEEDMKKDCLMKLTGFAKGTSREHIKEKLMPHGPIAYVDFKIGDEEAVIRFEESGVAKDCFEKAKTGEDEEKKVVINGAEISATFPEGEEEIEYWKKIVRAKSNFSKEKKNHKRRGGGSYGRGGKNFRGGRGRGRSAGRGRSEERNGDSDRKRAASSDQSEPPSKKEKVDS